LPPGATLSNGQAVTPSASQTWLWQEWEKYAADIAATAQHFKADKITVVINGDWGDINRHPGAPLIEYENRDTVLDWMGKMLNPLQHFAHKLYVARGTEAHVGGNGWLENRAAKEAQAEADTQTGLHSFWELTLRVEDVRFYIAHHPGANSRVPWTNGAAAIRVAAKFKQFYFDRRERPDVCVFSHVHHSEDSYDNQAPVRALFLPPWCLADPHAMSSGVIKASQQIGGIIVVVDGRRYQIFKRFRKLPELEEQWIKV